MANSKTTNRYFSFNTSYVYIRLNKYFTLLEREREDLPPSAQHRTMSVAVPRAKSQFQNVHQILCFPQNLDICHLRFLSENIWHRNIHCRNPLASWQGAGKLHGPHGIYIACQLISEKLPIVLEGRSYLKVLDNIILRLLTWWTLNFCSV